MQEPLIVLLRRATLRHHAAIEELFHLNEPFSLDHYIQVLQGFDFFLRAWEPALEAALPLSLRDWWRPRRRGAMVRADLDALGACRLEGEPSVPPLHSASAAMGSLYVLEGSVLGGKVIAWQAKAQHGLSPTRGAAYFHGWGERTVEHWREFQRVLAAHEPAAHGCDEACEAACRTFDDLGHAFRSATRATA